MPEEEKIWTKKKANLIFEIMRARFEDRVYEYLESGEYSSIEELDAWIDEKLRQYQAEHKAVKDYYDHLMGDDS